MPSTSAASGHRASRARKSESSDRLVAAGVPPLLAALGPSFIASAMERREWADIADLADEVGFLEGVVGSGSAVAGGGFSVTLHVVPSSAHEALDLIQRSTSGVIFLRAYQVPFSAFIAAEAGLDPDDAADEWETA